MSSSSWTVAANSSPKPESEHEQKTVANTCAATTSNITTTTTPRNALFLIDNPLMLQNKLNQQHMSINLTLSYDRKTHILICTVLKIENLPGTDINGLTDSYCKLNILPPTLKNPSSTRLRTSTVLQNCNPVFDETLYFYDIQLSDLAERSLYVIVVVLDQFGHEVLGQVQIGLKELQTDDAIVVQTSLTAPEPDIEQSQDWFDDMSYRGQISLGLTYLTKRKSLLVNIKECSNLLPMDNNASSDPFIKLRLEPGGTRKYKTRVKKKNLNPCYNEEFMFETSLETLKSQNLILTVWDKDFGKSDDYLGGLVIGSSSKCKRLEHWLGMIECPDKAIQQWHNLTEHNLDE